MPATLSRALALSTIFADAPGGNCGRLHILSLRGREPRARAFGHMRKELAVLLAAWRWRPVAQYPEPDAAGGNDGRLLDDPS